MNSHSDYLMFNDGRGRAAEAREQGHEHEQRSSQARRGGLGAKGSSGMNSHFDFPMSIDGRVRAAEASERKGAVA